MCILLISEELNIGSTLLLSDWAPTLAKWTPSHQGQPPIDHLMTEEGSDHCDHCDYQSALQNQTWVRVMVEWRSSLRIRLISTSSWLLDSSSTGNDSPPKMVWNCMLRHFGYNSVTMHIENITRVETFYLHYQLYLEFQIDGPECKISIFLTCWWENEHIWQPFHLASWRSFQMFHKQTPTHSH